MHDSKLPGSWPGVQVPSGVIISWSRAKLNIRDQECTPWATLSPGNIENYNLIFRSINTKRQFRLPRSSVPNSTKSIVGLWCLRFLLRTPAGPLVIAFVFSSLVKNPELLLEADRSCWHLGSFSLKFPGHRALRPSLFTESRQLCDFICVISRPVSISGSSFTSDFPLSYIVVGLKL
ncbi:hypothetical protein CBL_06088 [Carabus blaptoides fortunei]